MSGEAVVTYKASHQRADGGWRHIEITLPVGAGDELIDQAVATWHRTDEKALAALKGANDPAPEASADLVVDFGKHRGKPIHQIVKEDRGYVEWLAEKARSELVQRSARIALGENSTQNQATRAEQTEEIEPSETDDSIPF